MGKAEKRAQIEHRAQYFEHWYGMSRIDALRCATNEWKIQKALKQEFCHFTFKKKDGTMRTVLASKCKTIIPDHAKPKGTGGPYTEMQVRFFDVALGAWRSCRLENIVSVDW